MKTIKITKRRCVFVVSSFLFIVFILLGLKFTNIHKPSVYYSILVTGQSLSLGAFGTPALTTTQPYNNLMLDNSALVPLVENYINQEAVPNVTTETVDSAMANTITSLIGGPPYTPIIMSRNGVNGANYNLIKKNGGGPSYSNSISNITAINSLVTALPAQNRVLATVLIHGESDNNNIAAGGINTYADDISKLQKDYDADLKAITGQNQTIPMFIDQTMSFTSYGQTTSAIPSAQLDASEKNPDIYLVVPKYIFDYSKGAHLTNASYRWLGEYYGKVIKQVLLDNKRWIPLSPKSITRDKNFIYVEFNIPVGPIAIDTTNVLSSKNYGFEYYDDSSSAQISKVELTDNNIIKITLSNEPTGLNQRVRYAYTGTAGSTPGAQIYGSAKGNIRDSDNTPSLYGNYLYNWLVSFDKKINSK